ncbi:MAG: hypothetical protein ACPMAQ_03480 [Phycisphaerae bacterium]
MEGYILREHLQQDKRAAILAIVRMFKDFDVPYVITGGLAAQLYSDQPRLTVDVDVVSLRDRFQVLRDAAPWSRYGCELLLDLGRYVRLKHVAGNVEIDINLDARFARLLEGPAYEQIEGEAVAFASAAGIAFAKLRTQRSDWPRDPIKRVKDRADLMAILRRYPQIADQLRADPMTTDEMRRILDTVLADLRTGTGDELPPEDERSDS